MSARGVAAATDAAADRPVVIANVSRRRFLQGMRRSAASCWRRVSRRSARAQEPPKYGADGMPNGWVDNPLVFVSIGERRHRHHRLPSVGDGAGRADRHAA